MKRGFSNFSRGMAIAVALSGTTAIPLTALAQDAGPQVAQDGSSEMGDIIVTARRREESVQRVPVTINVISTEQLTNQGIRSVADLTQVIPGLKYQASGDRAHINFGLRGQSFSPGTAFPAVIPYFADVPLQRLSDGQFFDIEAIQVLKGPQGTLFGRVTDGGAILINPVKPGGEFEGYVQAQLGSYALRDIQGAVTLPILDDRISLRVAGSLVRRDGFTFNTFNGRDMDDLHSEAVRAGLVIKLSDTIENYTVVNYNRARTNGSAAILVDVNVSNGGMFPCCTTEAYRNALALQNALGPRQTSVGLVGPATRRRNGNFYNRDALWVVNTTTFDISDAMRVKNIFGYQWNKEQNSSDIGGTSSLGFSLNAYLPSAERYREQFTNELQVQGEMIDGRLDYIVGAYAEWGRPAGPNEHIAYVFDGIFSSATSTYTHTRSRALFGQIGFELLEGLKLNAGIRHTWDKTRTRLVQYRAFGDPTDSIPHGECRTTAEGLPPTTQLITPCTEFRESSDVTTYTLGVDYQLNRDVFLYASLRKGYRPGGINATVSNALPVPGYEPETNLSKEIGIKATYGTGAVRFRTNLSAFYDIFKGIQQSAVIVPPDDQQAAYQAIINAPRATIKGIELDQTVTLFDTLTLNVNWAYLDAKFDIDAFDYTPAQLASACPADPLTTVPNSTLICPLSPLPLTPKNTLTASADYRIDLGDRGEIHLGGNMYYTSDTFIIGKAVEQGTIPAYTIYNANVTWNNANGLPLDITVFVNNLTNKLYQSTLPGNFLDLGAFGTKTAFYGAPRMWGISTKYRF